MFTTSQAASILEIHSKTVTRYRERGLIAAHKYGRDCLIASEEFERLPRLPSFVFTLIILLPMSIAMR